MSEPTNEQVQMAAMFKALGDPTRLRIFEILCSCCDSLAVDVLTIEHSGDIHPLRGSTVGEICCRLNGAERITSTISHHLKELRLAGLITTERSGKNIICRVNQAALGELLAYFASHEQRMMGGECCCEPPPIISPNPPQDAPSMYGGGGMRRSLLGLGLGGKRSLHLP